LLGGSNLWWGARAPPQPPAGYGPVCARKKLLTHSLCVLVSRRFVRGPAGSADGTASNGGAATWRQPSRDERRVQQRTDRRRSAAGL